MSTIPSSVTDAAIAQAHEWLKIEETSASTKQLASMVHDPRGVGFTFAFVDRVARPEDPHVAAREFQQITRSESLPDFMGLVDKFLVTAGSFAAPLLPRVVMPIARAYLRRTVSHLVLDAESDALDALLTKAKADGFRLNVNLLGEAVLGEDEAERRRDGILELLKNPLVDYVSVKASSVASHLNLWDTEGSTARLLDRLRPLYRAAVRRSPHPFINLDMEEYKDLDLTLKLFTTLLNEEEFLTLEAGIVLQAYLPDTLDALHTLIDFAKERRAKGGAPIKIRLVKGANLSMEHVDAAIHDWPQAPYTTKDDVDANYLRLLDEILRPEHADAIRIGVASHNLYHVAFAVELARHRGVEKQLDIEMLQGMAPAQAEAVRQVVGELILYTPVVAADDFDVAISYLVRRLEENSAPQNFLYALFSPDDAAMNEQERGFLTALQRRNEVFAGARRTQDRTVESERQAGCRSEGRPGYFRNEPDTDPTSAANRAWALGLVADAANPGPATAELVTDTATVDAAVKRCRAAQADWAKRSGTERAELLDRVADALADRRGDLIAAAVHEAGKTVAQADPEVSEAIDFARYYAESARQLDQVRGARFEPYPVTVVTPPWNFPIAIPIGGVLAALAAGSCVILAPAPQVVRIAELLVEIMHDAGVGKDQVQLVNTDEAEAGQHLLSHPDVDSIILTGASDTARLFRGWSPRTPLAAETSGKNALIVTPAADPDLAVADIVASAYGHAGQKCSAASLIITVGSVGTSERFREQLIDAVNSLHVGPGHDISTEMNGLIEAPGEKLLRGLTQLDAGERWLVEPRPLNAERTLWSPGLRDNVKPGSWFHTHECFGPVAGIMHADTLEQAIAWQNSTGFGLTGGIHSLNEDEVALWRDTVEVGNAYIRRGITGAIVQRQPFGGWKNSSVGPGAKAGGPNYVAQQGRWFDGEVSALPTSTPTEAQNEFFRRLEQLSDIALSAGTAATVGAAVGSSTVELSAEDRAWLRTAVESDAHSWDTEFGREHDATGLDVESNVFRYRRLVDPAIIRVAADAAWVKVLRVLAAAVQSGSTVQLSVDPNLPDAAQRLLGALAESYGFEVSVEGDEALARTVRARRSCRVRLIGSASDAVYEAAAESSSVILDQEVVAYGRRELLPFLLEQAVSTTLHRFGVLTHK